MSSGESHMQPPPPGGPWMPPPFSIAQWLSGFDMVQYTAAFEANGYDRVDSIISMDEKDLEGMNVKKGHMKVMLAQIKAMQAMPRPLPLPRGPYMGPPPPGMFPSSHRPPMHLPMNGPMPSMVAMHPPMPMHHAPHHPNLAHHHHPPAIAPKEKDSSNKATITTDAKRDNNPKGGMIMGPGGPGRPDQVNGSNLNQNQIESEEKEGGAVSMSMAPIKKKRHRVPGKISLAKGNMPPMRMIQPINMPAPSRPPPIYPYAAAAYHMAMANQQQQHAPPPLSGDGNVVKPITTIDGRSLQPRKIGGEMDLGITVEPRKRGSKKKEATVEGKPTDHTKREKEKEKEGEGEKEKEKAVKKEKESGREKASANKAVNTISIAVEVEGKEREGEKEGGDKKEKRKRKKNDDSTGETEREKPKRPVGMPMAIPPPPGAPSHFPYFYPPQGGPYPGYPPYRPAPPPPGYENSPNFMAHFAGYPPGSPNFQGYPPNPFPPGMGMWGQCPPPPPHMMGQGERERMGEARKGVVFPPSPMQPGPRVSIPHLAKPQVAPAKPRPIATRPVHPMKSEIANKGSVNSEGEKKKTGPRVKKNPQEKEAERLAKEAHKELRIAAQKRLKIEKESRNKIEKLPKKDIKSDEAKDTDVKDKEEKVISGEGVVVVTTVEGEKDGKNEVVGGGEKKTGRKREAKDSDSTTEPLAKKGRKSQNKKIGIAKEIEENDNQLLIPSKKDNDITNTNTMKTKVESDDEVLCSLCGRGEKDEELGELDGPHGKDREGEEIWVHEDCAMWTPEFYIEPTKGEPMGLDKIVNRGKNLKCNFCSKKGATIGCKEPSCRRTFHYKCIVSSGGVKREEDYFVYCHEHKDSMDKPKPVAKKSSARTPK
eukprot:Ihof_evm1s572 gene=Ihof_evmTU1s572